MWSLKRLSVSTVSSGALEQETVWARRRHPGHYRKNDHWSLGPEWSEELRFENRGTTLIFCVICIPALNSAHPGAILQPPLRVRIGPRSPVHLQGGALGAPTILHVASPVSASTSSVGARARRARSAPPPPRLYVHVQYWFSLLYHNQLCTGDGISARL